IETTDLRHTLERVTGHDLERFFYDWTERPGHPVLEVASDYENETRQAHIHVKQTQTGEAFHFPLRVLAVLDTGEPVRIEETITEKEHRLTLPLKSRPVRLEIDPEQAVLAEVKETKGRDLWLAQLTAGSSVAARVRAAEHFGKSKEPADREALVRALKTEKL